MFEEIFNSELKPNVDEVLRAIDEEDGNLNRDLVAREVEAMAHDMAAAIDALYELVPVSENHDDWLAFRRKHSIEIGHRNLWEWVYDKVCEKRRGEAKAVAHEAMKNSPYGRLFALTQQQDYSLLTAGFTPPAISAANRMIRSQREMARVDALESRIGEAEAELRALAQERRLAEETYDATRQPEGFVLALQVLTFLAVVGMGVPVILMGFAPMTLPAWARVAVISLFFVGVGMLLRFLFVYAGFLREGGRETLPRSLLGLLRRAPRVATSGT